MKSEFNFILSYGNDLTIFKAVKMDDTGIYKISWDNGKEFELYLPEYVEKNLNDGNWIVV